MKLPISANKFIPPQLASDTICRQQVLEQLALGKPHCRLIMIQAPAGYGKTTTMLQYRQHLQRSGYATAWITLDEADNDMVRFLDCIDHALDEIKTSEHGIPDTPSPFSRLLAAIEQTSNPTCIFLDDFETIHEPELINLVGKCINALAPGNQLVIGSRDMPDLPVSRMLIANEAILLCQDTLRFQLGEANCFIDHKWPSGMDEEIRSALYKATEGWPAAMQLSAIALRNKAVTQENLPQLLNSTPLISRYVIENVLQTLPERLTAFLLKTCCLRRLSAPLCNAITGLDNSQQLLEELTDKGCFLQPLDLERKWFVHHKLFAELLRQEQVKSHPAEYQTACRQASVWLEQNERPGISIDYALEAGDRELACRIMEKHILSLLFDARIGTIDRWVKLIEGIDLCEYPKIQYAACWAAIFGHDFARAQTIISQLEALPKAFRQRLPAGRSLVILQTSLYLIKDKSRNLVRQIRSLLKNTKDAHSFNQLARGNLYAYALLMQGKADEAMNQLKQSYQLRYRSTDRFAETYYDSFLGLTYVIKGQLEQGIHLLDDARLRLGPDLGTHCLPEAVISPVKALVLYERNLPEDAVKLLELQLPIINRFCILDWIAMAYTTLSRAYFLQGQTECALRRLEELERYGYADNWPRLIAIARWERVRLATLQGNYRHAEQIMEGAIKEHLPSESKLSCMMPAEIEHNGISQLRLAIHQQQFDGVETRLTRETDKAISGSRHYRALRLQLLHVLLDQQTGRHQQALDRLRRLLEQFFPLGFVRSFVDEGETLCQLLQQVSSEPTEAGGCAKQLLASVSGEIDLSDQALDSTAPTSADTVNQPAEALTSREAQVLRLLATGKPNRAIAETLYVSEATVKWHLGNIYSKLGVKQRTQAIAQSRRLGLLD